MSRKAIVALTAFLVCFGCSKDGPDKLIVEGSILFDGQPVTNGEIRFYPIEGTPGAVSGGPIVGGEYVARAKGGVPVGKHRVEVRGFRSPTTKANPEDIRLEGGPAEQYIPARFNDVSELVAEIQGRSPVTQNYELTSN